MTTKHHHAILRLVCLAGLCASVAGAGAALAEESSRAGAAHANSANAALYCANIASAAADARYARQMTNLADLEQQLEERIAELEAKRAEFELWVERRENLADKAEESVVAIYSQMRPDAASQQIAVMDSDSAAAILAKLKPRTASAILNEMDPETAAHLTNVMAGRDIDDDGSITG